MIIQQLFMGIIGWIARSFQCTFFLNCICGALMLKPDNNKCMIHAVCYVLQAYSVVLCEWNERRYGIGKLVFFLWVVHLYRREQIPGGKISGINQTKKQQTKTIFSRANKVTWNLKFLYSHHATLLLDIIPRRKFVFIWEFHLHF